jgi:hypothetical protein
VIEWYGVASVCICRILRLFNVCTKEKKRNVEHVIEYGIRNSIDIKQGEFTTHGEGNANGLPRSVVFTHIIIRTTAWHNTKPQTSKTKYSAL